MKKISKAKLTLKTETIRQLDDKELLLAAGGENTGAICYTGTCVPGACVPGSATVNQTLANCFTHYVNCVTYTFRTC